MTTYRINIHSSDLDDARLSKLTVHFVSTDSGRRCSSMLDRLKTIFLRDLLAMVLEAVEKFMDMPHHKPSYISSEVVGPERWTSLGRKAHRICAGLCLSFLVGHGYVRGLKRLLPRNGTGRNKYVHISLQPEVPA